MATRIKLWFEGLSPADSTSAGAGQRLTVGLVDGEGVSTYYHITKGIHMNTMVKESSL